MRALALVSILALGACSSLSGDQASRLDAGLVTYVKLVPRRGTMDEAELTSHALLGSSLLEATGRLSGRIK